MKRLVRVVSLTMVCLGAIAGSALANAVPGTSALPDRERVRSELSSYFRDIQSNSPNVLGGLAKSPEAMAAVQQRIARMDDAELLRFQKLMAETPDWKLAPEAFASAFPPEVLSQVRGVAADFAGDVPEGKIMRDDVRALVRVLKLMPDAKLTELGIDRKMIASLDETFAGMTPLQLAMLQKRVDAGPWRQKSAEAIHALPPALQRGAAVLAEHGPLTETDIKELNDFRGELMGLLSRIDKLPPQARQRLKLLDTEDVRAQLTQLSQATPDTLFMMRHSIPQEMLPTLRRNVAFLERVSTFSKDELAGFEHFRGELTQAFRQVKVEGQEEWQGASEMMAKLGPEDLFVLQKRMASLGGWQVALPAVYQTLASPETAARLHAVQGSSPDPEAVRSLEAFRQQALTYIDAVAPTSGLDAEFTTNARQAVQNAPLDRLELMRLSAERLPASASAADRLSIVAINAADFSCSLSMTAVPEVCFPEVCVPEIGVCPVCTPAFCTPAGCTPAVTVTADFSGICNPIKNALKAIETGITTSGNAAVETMRSAIQTSINSVQASVNASVSSVNNIVNTSVNAITDTVNQIAAFAQTLPDLAWSAIKLALNLLLDIKIKNGVTVRDLVAQGPEQALNSMKTLLGLAGDWWTAISNFTLPMIPCPPAGFHTPFGNMGDSAAADNYGRYRLMIDGIVGMIPDTETSLAIKIPAQVTFMMFDFLGTCLSQAAADADTAELTTRHDLVIANFAAMQVYVKGQVTGLTSTAGTQSSGVLNALTKQKTTTQAALASQGVATRALVGAETVTVQNLVKTDSAEILALVQRENDATQVDVKESEDLDLRLTIERALQAGDEVASFEILEPAGHLRLVSTIVDSTLKSMILAGEGIGQAQKYFDGAMVLMTGGNYKSSYKEFIKSYREAVK